MPRGGSKPGERRGGRKRGSLNKATQARGLTISELAQQYTDVALNALVAVASKPENDSAKASAANSILDRGYGKARQEITGKDGGPIEFDFSHMSDDDLTSLRSLLSLAIRSGGGAGASRH